MEQNLFFQFLIAWLLGAFIWLERDLPNKKGDEDIENYWWLRSYALTSILWAVCAWIDTNFNLWYLTVTTLIVISSFILFSHIYWTIKREQFWVTTEYAWILTYFIWVLVILSSIKLSIIFTIFIAVLLSLKSYFEKIKENLSRQELIHTLKFLVVAFVILPLLPDEKYSFATLLNEFWVYSALDWKNSILTMAFINPYSLWFFIVLMSSISYIWYILSKFFSKDSSIILSSIVWWMVSSTAVTASMSELSKSDGNNHNIYTVWTMLANTIMLARVVIIVIVFNISLLPTIIIPAILMFLWLLLPTIYFYKKSKTIVKKSINMWEKLESPFSITPALKFGLFVLFVKFLAWLWNIYKDSWWDFYYYILWIVSWLTDVDAITNTMATDTSIVPELAVMVILLAAMSNNIVKWSIAFRFWEKTFWRNVMWSFLISIILWIIWIVYINV